VHVDKQGRLVLPQHVREELVDVPGDVLLEWTPDGVLLRAVHGPTSVRLAADGLPVLDLDRPVTNEEVLAAIDRERGER
jgi:bifunctional DNA-binding transcriptional regulator/antitoxin component of YhaV-PrlF toxin-antitoxin module